MNTAKELYDRWLAQPELDTAVAEELHGIAGDDAAITDRFYRDLEFGTGGLRGVLGAGTNRMNLYTVRKATQGLADYLNATDLPKKIAIAHDSRNNGELFTREAARVLAANGITACVYPRLEPTPALSWAVRYLGCGAGVCITASHNPAKYNGYKVYGTDGCQITLEVADKILAAIEKVDCFDGVKLVDYEAGVQAGRIVSIDDKCLDDFVQAVYDQRVGDGTGIEQLKLVYTPLNGTGLECVKKLLAKLGVTHVTVVPEQETPDGNFPTCPYPNPEIREAMQKGLELCDKVHPDLLLGTDPDCDRCGTAVPDGKGGYRLITGNEMGIILLDYVCRTRLARGTMPKNPVAVTTIVSTDMATPVAKKYGVELRRTLTGFKFIGEQIGKLEAEGHVERYIFGFEESYGYLSGGHVRDKDAVNATLLVCEAAAWYAQQGMTLLDAIEALYKEFGYYRNALCSFAFEGETGMYTMQNLMKTLRADPPKEILDVTLSESAANRHHGKAFTWGGLWKTRTLWGVLLIRFVSDPVWYFCLFWLPGYLQEDSGLTLIQVGWVGWIPFLFGAVGGVLTSAWSDKMVRKGMDPLRARKRMMTLVAVAAPLCIFTPYFNALPPYWNVAAIIASFSLIAIMCLSWLYTICVVIAEAFPVRNVASVVGITAGFGAVGGAIFNYYVGQLLSTMGPSLFLVMGVLHWIAVVILWKMTRPEIPQEKQAVQK